MRLNTHHDGHGLTELCEVRVLDEAHPVNGAHHLYQVGRRLSPQEQELFHQDSDYLIAFQRGPRDVAGSTPGILDSALLAVLIHRYECFQAGPFSCQSNDQVLHHLRLALDLIKVRATERAQRGVLGKNER